MAGKYVRMKAPEDVTIEEFGSTIASKFAAADKKGKGAVFASVTPDVSHADVVCAKVQGRATDAQMAAISAYTI